MNTVERYIQTEKLALKTTIPIDRYVKDRPAKIETYKLEYRNEKIIMTIRENLIQTIKSFYVQTCMKMKSTNR